MRYLSVCSGIEAATVAWEPLGWTPVAFAEIEKFPSAVLAYHYPDVPNLEDMTKIDGRKYRGAVDLIVGGTPCQDFSIAGKRAGMAGERGGLALAFVDLVRDVSPRWIVWENVPGVLSSNGGNDFADFLLALRKCGYHVGYRILDAQYFGVPQRRRRVFLVGYFGDWRPAAAVLFEPHCLRRDTQPRRKAKENVAGSVKASLGGRGWPQDPEAACGGFLQVTQALTGRLGGGGPDDNKAQGGFYVASYGGNFAGQIDVGTTLKSGNQKLDMESETFITYPLRAQSQNAHDESLETYVAAVSPTVCAGPPFERTGNDRVEADALVVAFHGSQDPDVSGDVTHPCGRNGGRNTAKIFGSSVRRLTVTECERLMGLPDNYTAIPYKRPFADLPKPILERSYRRYLHRMARQGKEPMRLGDLIKCADGPRYRAIGNSMVVPVMRWIGERIEKLEKQ